MGQKIFICIAIVLFSSISIADEKSSLLDALGGDSGFRNNLLCVAIGKARSECERECKNPEVAGCNEDKKTIVAGKAKADGTTDEGLKMSCNALLSGSSSICESPSVKNCQTNYDEYKKAAEEFGGKCRGTCQTDIDRCLIAERSNSTMNMEWGQMGEFASMAMGMFGNGVSQFRQLCKDDAYYEKDEINKQTADAKTELERVQDKYREQETKEIEAKKSDSETLNKMREEMIETQADAQKTKEELDVQLAGQATKVELERQKILDGIQDMNKQIDDLGPLSMQVVNMEVSVSRNSLLDECTEKAEAETKAYFAERRAKDNAGIATDNNLSESLTRVARGASSTPKRAHYNQRLQVCLRKKQGAIRAIEDKHLVESKKLESQRQTLANKVSQAKAALDLLENQTKRDADLMRSQATTRYFAAQNRYLSKVQQIEQFQQLMVKNDQTQSQNKQSLGVDIQRATVVYENLKRRGGGVDNESNRQFANRARTNTQAERFSDQLNLYQKKETLRENAAATCCSEKTIIDHTRKYPAGFCDRPSYTTRMDKKLGNR